MVDCFYEKILEEKLRENLDFYNFMFNKLFSVEEVSFQETFEKALSYGAVSYTHLTLPTTPYV